MTVIEMRRGDWIQTYSGRKFWPLDARPEDVSIDDVAHALSLTCRFGGHCCEFYSVAEHSVRVSRLCSREHALWGLLHDASEAYLADVPRPLKAFLPGYKDAERAVEAAIAKRFGLPSEMPAEVKRHDAAMLSVEAEQIMSAPPTAWSDIAPPADVMVECWHPDRAKAEFLMDFARLTGVL